MSNLNHDSFLPRIVFKIKDNIDLPGSNEHAITEYFRTCSNIQWNDFFAVCPYVQIKRLFCTLQPSEITQLIEKAKSLDASYKDPELLYYFVLTSSNEKTAQKALQALLQMEQIETAYLQGRLINPSAAVKKKSLFTPVDI
jgi:hypothetical protein